MNMNTKLKVQVFLVTIILLLLPINSVSADTGEIPDDPGVGDDQDTVILGGINWIFPEYGATWVDLNDPSIDVSLDWSSLAIAGKIKTTEDHYVFVGISDTTYILDEEAHDEYHPGQGSIEGFAFGLGLLKNLAGCDTAWLDPGKIIATAEKVAPEYPVVVGQDPNDTGVYLSYSLTIEPTILYYEKWGKIAQVQACVNDENPEDILEVDCEIKQNGTVQCNDQGTCPDGYSKQNTQLWGCKVEQKEYRENIETITPMASLTAVSRDWILGTLSGMYPGAYLQHPVWGFDTATHCSWESNTCYWTYSGGSIPVVDPGWYDMKLMGITGGTKVTPPRSFNFELGQFGVFLIDASQIY